MTRSLLPSLDLLTLCDTADSLQNTPMILSFTTISTFLLCVYVCACIHVCRSVCVRTCVETRGQPQLLAPRVLPTLFSKMESVAGLALVGWAQEAGY